MPKVDIGKLTNEMHNPKPYLHYLDVPPIRHTGFSKLLEERYELERTDDESYDFSEQRAVDGASLEIVVTTKQTYRLKPNVVQTEGEEK